MRKEKVDLIGCTAFFINRRALPNFHLSFFFPTLSHAAATTTTCPHSKLHPHVYSLSSDVHLTQISPSSQLQLHNFSKSNKMTGGKSGGKASGSKNAQS